jgi:hypothetical protein
MSLINSVTTASKLFPRCGGGMRGERGRAGGIGKGLTRSAPSSRMFFALCIVSLFTVLVLNLQIPAAAVRGRGSRRKGGVLEEGEEPLARPLLTNLVVASRTGGGGLLNMSMNVTSARAMQYALNKKKASDQRQKTQLNNARLMGGPTNESLGGVIFLPGYGDLNLTGMPSFLQEIYRRQVQPQTEVCRQSISTYFLLYAFPGPNAQTNIE